jgi:hypothetical protein
MQNEQWVAWFLGAFPDADCAAAALAALCALASMAVTATVHHGQATFAQAWARRLGR